MTQQTVARETQDKASVEIDALKLQRFRQKVQENQNLTLGLFGGLAAALAGAGAWGLITGITHIQIGWMAVGVGFLVGFAVRRFGQGMDRVFGIMGAALSLFGCLLGNLLSVCIMIAAQEGLGLAQVLAQLNTGIALNLMKATFHPLDVLFYGLALYWGYRFSFRRFSPDELKSLVK